MTVGQLVASATALPSPRSQNRDLDLRTLADAYLAAYDGRDHSRHHYLSQWLDKFGDRKLSELDADVIEDALDEFARTPALRYLGRDKATGEPIWKPLGLRRPATINRMKSSLSALLTWARRRRLAPRGWVNPCREIPASRENNARTRFLSPDERERLLKMAKVSSWPRLHLLILMALTTGARRGELLGLRVGDLDLRAGTARLARTKNGEPRVLPLTPAVIAEIRRLSLPHPDAFLFASRYRDDRSFNIETAWRRAVSDAGIDNFRFHDLRHSCASYLAQSGASLIEIADVLGHRSLDVTRRYAHLTVDTKRQLVHRVLGGIS